MSDLRGTADAEGSGMARMDYGRALPAALPVRSLAVVNVLREDPELGAGLAADDFAIAARAAVARGMDLEPGDWPFESAERPGALGVLILEGVVLARVGIGHRAHAEILSAGDVMLPWLEHQPGASVGSVVSGQVIERTTVALLDRAFATRTAPWPEIAATVLGRAVLRARRCSVQAAVNAIPRMQDRVEVTLWQLADRFGHVTPAGVVLELPLTHMQLAQLIGGQRPSVTTALTALRVGGRLEQTRSGAWLLHERPDTLAELSDTVATGA